MYKIDELYRESYIEKEMNNYKKEALRKISNVVAHPLAENFAKTLAYAWFDSQEFAEKIANELDLDKIDFISILQDEKTFENLLKIQQERIYG